MPTPATQLRAPVLLPAPGNSPTPFTYLPDAAVLVSERGILESLTPFDLRPPSPAANYQPAGLLLPPLVDCHIHIPQWPIRGRFMEGIAPPGGLLEGLARNVYPAEARCSDPQYAADVARAFLDDTRAHGTLGGVAYMTSHPAAARAALTVLPDTWRVGLVLMDQNCPPQLQISPAEALTAYRELHRDFGSRVVLTDRFAVACSSTLRRPLAALAAELNLTTQTHLSEQPAEIQLIRSLYPHAKHYTDVYERDGLLRNATLLAHCIHLNDDEWQLLADRGCVVCHCPVSNTELRSGVLNLHLADRFNVPWALCTDVGASPTTSLLHELSHFLVVHQHKPWHHLATPERGLLHATTIARKLAAIPLGGLEPGKNFAALELALPNPPTGTTPAEVIRALLESAPHPRPSRIWQ